MQHPRDRRYNSYLNPHHKQRLRGESHQRNNDDQHQRSNRGGRTPRQLGVCDDLSHVHRDSDNHQTRQSRCRARCCNEKFRPLLHEATVAGGHSLRGLAPTRLTGAISSPHAASVNPEYRPSSVRCLLRPVRQGPLGDTEVLRDLRQRRLALPGHHHDIDSELSGIRLCRRDILPGGRILRDQTSTKLGAVPATVRDSLRNAQSRGT